jgi:regulator of protease activity HflC (stomatin/prohibitin superfamily)
VSELTVDTKSKENTFCKIKLSIHAKYRQEDIRTAHYSIVDGGRKNFLGSHVTSIIRAVIPTMTLEEIFTSSSKLATAFKDELGEKVTPYGMDIVNVLILEIEPDHVVKQAMNAMNAAERDRVTAISVAEANKITQVKRAEGEAEARHLAGVGVANARRAIAEGLADSMAEFSKVADGGMTQSDVMELILATQYYDMLRDVGTRSGSTVIYLPPNASDAQQMAAQHREAALSALKPLPSIDALHASSSSVPSPPALPPPAVQRAPSPRPLKK